MPAFHVLIDTALTIAARAHREQVRKDAREPIPYIAHAAGVGMVLQRAGFDEETVAAGILHDVLEDTACTRTELIGDVGQRVAMLVDWVTEQDKSLPWEQRKTAYIERILRAPDEAKAISLADKIHNLKSIARALDAGEDIWQRFKRGPEQKLGHYRRVIEGCAGAQDPRVIELLTETRSALEDIVRRIAVPS